MFICQIRGNLHLIEIWQSRAKLRVLGEGVETSWQTSKIFLDEGIVQTSNPKGVAKAIVVSITGWSLVQSQVGPPLDF